MGRPCNNVRCGREGCDRQRRDPGIRRRCPIGGLSFLGFRLNSAVYYWGRPWAILDEARETDKYSMLSRFLEPGFLYAVRGSGAML